MLKKAKLQAKALIVRGAVKCIRFTSANFTPKGCNGMSKVNNVYFHRVLQMQLSLLLTSFVAVIWKNYFSASYTLWLIVLFLKVVAPWIYEIHPVQ